MKKLLVILGPTSTGKTDVALALAKKFNGELVSCDSRQVYKDLDIGTGKMPGKEVSVKKHKGYWVLDTVGEAPADAVKIWMYDVVDFKKQYTVFHYISDAKKVIDDIESRGKLPIIVGGTGLYLKAFLEGMSNLSVPIDKNLRQILKKLTVKELQDKLKNLSSLKWESLNNSDKHNSRRLIRAIELVAISSSNIRKTPQGLVKNHEILKIGLNSSKEKLYAKVDQRVVSRIKLGMIEEAEILHEKGLTVKRMRQLGLEYGLLADYLEKKITIEGLIAKMQSKIHQFVKRQQTWYKKDTQIEWFEISNNDYLKKLEKRVYRWYYDLR